MLIKVNKKRVRKPKRLLLFAMNRRRLYISVLLMILAIAAIIIFQGYWLFKNYQEEEQSLRVQTNILFREAIFQVQAKKLKLDTSVKFRHRSPGNVVTATRDGFHDSLRARNTSFKSKVIFRGTNQGGPVIRDSSVIEIDSGRVRKLVIASPADAKTFIKVLETTTGIQDSITVPEVEQQYRTMLAREKINLAFTITKTPGIGSDEFLPPDLEGANEVSIGLLKPSTFRVDLGNTTGYILRKMSPIILVSTLLIALTVLSFLLLFRNLMRQRRLTQLKNDFISNITHELKTPIATVSVAIEAMKNFNVLDDPQRTQEYLNISANELQRLSLLVDKVLRLSMFEKKEILFKKEMFDFSQLATEVMDSMKLQFEKSQAETSLEFIGVNFMIEADKRHLASVIYNLLDNAVKYSNEKPVINVSITDRQNFLELRVSDNGIGIPNEYRNKIFEQFFRVPSGDRHNIKGYGLGLSYVNHIVRSHMGFIELETDPGKGSTFIIRLPFMEAPVIHFDGKRKVRKIQFKL